MKKTIYIYLSILFSNILLLNSSTLIAQDFSYWKKNNLQNINRIQHQVWDDFLKKYIKTDPSNLNLFQYNAVKKEDKNKLDSYVSYLSGITITNYNKKEQLAYWINLYNSLTIKVVLENYPVKSIKDIKLSGILKPGPWKKELISIESRKLSLDNIEHDILRPIWQDNRVHYAVNCASIGCPNLQNSAFTSKNSESLLKQGAKDYINHPRGVYLNGKVLKVSSIYKWFKEDFGNSKDSLLKHLILYSNQPLKAKLQNFSGKIKYGYDWSLNEVNP